MHCDRLIFYSKLNISSHELKTGSNRALFSSALNPVHSAMIGQTFCMLSPPDQIDKLPARQQTFTRFLLPLSHVAFPAQRLGKKPHGTFLRCVAALLGFLATRLPPNATLNCVLMFRDTLVLLGLSNSLS